MTKRFGGAVTLCLTSLFLFATPVMSRQSRCGDCHFSRPEAPAPDHLADWDRSAHSRNNVACEKCHGGDATTFESFLAHRGILNSTNPASPVNRRNLSATCGTCHAGPFVAFQISQHFALLEKVTSGFPCVDLSRRCRLCQAVGQSAGDAVCAVPWPKPDRAEARARRGRAHPLRCPP